jgi:hypothetical protein
LVKVFPKLFTRNEELFLIIDHCKLADILKPVKQTFGFKIYECPNCADKQIQLPQIMQPKIK